MAAAVLKPDQDYLPECNQQPSRPLGRLLQGGWTPQTWPFSGLAWLPRYRDPTPELVVLGAWLDPSLGQEEGRGRRKGT